jgi:hypothetical protein
MAADWLGITIGQLCDEGVVDLQTGPFGTQLHARDYVDDGVPVVPTEAIRNRQIDHSVLPKISLDKAKELSRHRLEPGDTLFARRGVQATKVISDAFERPRTDFSAGRARFVSASKDLSVMSVLTSYRMYWPIQPRWSGSSSTR